MDYNWTTKESRMYWRGSTTGGFSRDGGWRRQHRQRIVRKINAADNAAIMVDQSGGSGMDWAVKTVSRKDYAGIFDVHLSHVGQCDPGDCTAQEEFFELAEPAEQQEAWKAKFLLDI